MSLQTIESDPPSAEETPAPRKPFDELSKTQFDYALKWFVYHADQRIKAFNFMIVALGVLTAAMASAVDKVDHRVLGCFGFLAFLVALLFSRLDRRNRDLVWRGEDVLLSIERETLFTAEMKGRKKKVFQGILLQDEGARAPMPKNDVVLDFLQDLGYGKHRVIIPLFAYVFATAYMIAAIYFFFFKR